MKNRSRRRPALAPSGDPRDLVNLLPGFLENLSIKNYSPRTIKNTDWHLFHFLAWCNERELARPAHVTKPALDRYQRHLFYYRSKNGRPLSFRAQHLRLSAIKLFFRYLAKNNFIAANPASEIEMPSLGTRLPRSILSAADVETILSKPDLATPLGTRDRALLETLYSTGLRRFELAGLKLYDLDLERGTVFVRQGKGDKDRLVPIGERAVTFLVRYIEDVRPSLAMEPDEAYVFLTHQGLPFTPDTLGLQVKKHVESSGLKKKGACHLFRHAMATLMLEGGADIRFIQAMLGHSKLTSTEIYTHVSIQKLKEIHSATHPGARLRPKGEREGPAEG